MLKGFVSGEEKDIVRIPMKGKNLFDESKVTLDAYLSGTDGKTGSSTVSDVTDYIDINSSPLVISGVRTIDILNSNSRGLCFYDSNKIYIRGLSYSPDVMSTPVIISNIPSNAKYVRFAFDKAFENGIMLNLGSTPLPYEPYGYQEGWEVRDNQDRLIWGREDELQTATGTLPFKGYSLPLKVKSLLGNSVQNGTPAPDNIIMPEMCGKLVDTDWTIPFTNAGQTTPVYLGEVLTVRRVKKLVLTGEETFVQSSTQSVARVRTSFTPKAVASATTLLMCTHYVANAGARDGCTTLSSDGGTVYFSDNTNAQSTDTFKQYLASEYAAGHPVTIWYVLNTEQTTISNEPLCKISTYADELNDTVATLPEIPTTTGQNTLTIGTTIAPYEVTVDGHIKHGYWGKIREDVRNGVAQTKFPVGTIFYDNGDETTGTAFQVVGYDKHFDPEMTARGYTHSMTLCELKLTDLVTFDAIEALLYVETAIAPGTYRFKIPNYDATYGGNKSYYFTTTKSIPVGGQITINWPYQQTPKTASTYSEIAGVTAIESGLTLSEWIEGDSPAAIDLGTAAGPNAEIGTSSFGKMNHIHRARYGSNNYLQSGIRQYINSDKAASSWWSPQTVFDRPYGSRTSAGKLTKLSSEFVDALVKPEIKSRANSYFETDSLDGTKFSVSTEYTITTDKMFLLSPNEVGLNADTTIGSTLDYYLNATNADRIKHRASNDAAYYWWLRTPNPTYAYNVRSVFTSGALNYSNASLTYGVAAACVIQ